MNTIKFRLFKLFLPVSASQYVSITLQRTLPRSKIKVAFIVTLQLQYVSDSCAHLYNTKIFNTCLKDYIINWASSRENLFSGFRQSVFQTSLLAIETS